MHAHKYLYFFVLFVLYSNVTLPPRGLQRLATSAADRAGGLEPRSAPPPRTQPRLHGRVESAGCIGRLPAALAACRLRWPLAGYIGPAAIGPSCLLAPAASAARRPPFTAAVIAALGCWGREAHAHGGSRVEQ